MHDTEKKKIRVAWGCSMRGGYKSVSKEDVAKIPEVIKELGYELASEHQVQSGIIEQENQRKPSEIHDRDYDWLSTSRVGIFEISNPSLGVGGEIADMVHLGKPVLCLYCVPETQVSAYIRGLEGTRVIPNVTICRKYGNLDQARQIIMEFMKNLGY